MACLLKGDELALLINKECRESRVLEFLPSERECAISDDNSIPWFVIWLGSLFSPKYRHTLRSVPRLTKTRWDIAQFINKIKWRAALKDDNNGEVVRIVRKPAPCTHLVEPELVAWCSRLRNNLLRSVNAGTKQGGDFNSSQLFMWALRQLKNSDYCFLPNDKDGGWSIMRKTDRDDLFLKTLSNGNYMAIDAVDSNCGEIALGLMRRVVQQEEDPRWFAAMRKASRQSSIVAKLSLLVKSHKDRGEVSCRAVHACPSFGYEAHARWLMQLLRGALVGHESLVRSSKDVVQKLADVKIANSLFLVKLDIKDFYVVGQDYRIAELVASLFQDRTLRSLVQDVTYFLLSNQYVQHGPDLYKVKQGCGIGLLHAGDLADAVFYALCEKSLFATDEYVACGIIQWFRFGMTCYFFVLPQLASELSSRSTIAWLNGLF